MAKFKKFPKQPKKSSSMAVWQRYEARCAEIARYNSEIKKAPQKKEAILAKVQKLKMR